MRFDYKGPLDRLFLTSDHHFRHKGIIDFCSRPFENVDEMDKAMIDAWNKKVPPDADVIHHGDLCWTGNVDYIDELIHSLNGRIHLILGNHCYQNKLDRPVFKEMFERKGGSVSDILTTIIRQDNNRQLISCHYPLLFWPSRTIMTHGHIHSGKKSISSEVAPFNSYRHDVGVDNTDDYAPISYIELSDIIIENLSR